MGYSLNFYLDNAVSLTRKKKIIDSKDKDSIKELNKRINNMPLQIFAYLRYPKKTIKVYIERKCSQKQWNSGKQEVDPRYFKSGAISFNKYIERIKNEILKKVEENLERKIPTTKDHLKVIIYNANEKEYAGTSLLTFQEAYQEFIKVSSIKKQPSTITVYKTTLKHLNNFSENRRIPLSFENIDRKFEDLLREYLLEEAKLTNNSIAKYIKTLKTFLNYCTDRGYNNKLDFRKFDVIEREREVYALSMEELMKIYDHDFGNNETLARVKDVFCFACFTGLRFSDVAGLHRENIIQGEKIHLTIKKTNETTYLPLNLFAQKILTKYELEEFPLPVISSQKTNEYLKIIGEKLNINEPVRIIQFRGYEKSEKYVPKYKVLTFHVARKTFITNSLILGMQERVVKEFSGHKKEENFRKYVKYADSYKLQIMNDIWNEENITKAK